MGGESQPSNTTQTVVPWSGVQPYLLEGFEALSGTDVPEYYPNSTVAPQGQNTLTGISNVAGSADSQQDIANTTAQGFDFTMNQMLDPATNQYLAATAEAAIKPIFDTLNNETISGIDDAAIQANQFGGTAQRNTQLDAIDKATQNALDTSAAIYSDAYQTSLDNYTSTLLNAPIIQGTQTAPGQTLISAGALEDLYAQEVLNAEIDRFNYDQTGEIDYITQMLNTYLGVPMGSNTVAEGGGTSPFQSALGGAAAGLALSGGNPWGALAGGVGGLVLN